MKKLFFLTLLCIASSLLIFHSCSKDIDNNKVKLDYQKVKSDYKRPVNSTELTSILNNSKEVVLVNLSCSY
jgi:nickel-dependent lactate racemase